MERIYKYESYDHEYERELCERFHDILPERVFDSHFHLSPIAITDSDKRQLIPECHREVAPDQVIDAYREVTEIYLGKGKLKGGLLLGNPSRFPTLEAADADRTFTCETAANNEGFVGGIITRPVDDQKHIAEFIERYPSIAALKPYHCYSNVENNFEADILTYAPEWMWELAEQYSLPVVVHLSHYGDMLKDKANIRDIRYICQKYPRAKVVLAHCALGHHPDKLNSGIPQIADLPNIYMDCSGVSEALSIIYSLRAFGPSRLMYGSDGYGFGMTFSRVFAVGSNFMGLGKIDIPLPRDYQYRPLNNVCENLLALTSACDVCGLTRDELDQLYYGTAAELYYNTNKNAKK